MIDTKDFKFPKPGHKAGAVKLSAYRYKKWKAQVWEKQGRRCKQCRQILTEAKNGHLHHYMGRGLGGGKRDDRKTYLLCPDCHEKEHAR